LNDKKIPIILVAESLAFAINTEENRRKCLQGSDIIPTSLKGFLNGTSEVKLVADNTYIIINDEHKVCND
jgi:hypothetical protein